MIFKTQPGLIEPTASISEPMLSTSTFDSPLDINEVRQEPVKLSESVKTEVLPLLSPRFASNAPSASTSTLIPISVETPTKKKDEKEPIQIIRGGRVITLPPIEAPATRSKRLQAKPETPQKAPEPIRKEEKPMYVIS